MMNDSVWSEFADIPSFEKLNNDISCEVLIIGGGLAGILTAHFLNEQGKKVVLVEAKKIGRGITKNTTAVITAQHDATYGRLVKMHGKKRAKTFFKIIGTFFTFHPKGLCEQLILFVYIAVRVSFRLQRRRSGTAGNAIPESRDHRRPFFSRKWFENP